MGDITSLKQNRKCKNLVCAIMATYRTGMALEKFTVHGLQLVHSKIQQTLGDNPKCTTYCSRDIKDVNRWCDTCFRWKTELEAFLHRRCHRIQWKNRKSWLWPNGARDIAEIFILPGWDTNNINLQDISTIYNVWNRCVQFQSNVVQVLFPLKECRNEVVHNIKNMKLTSARKKVVFQNISKVIEHPNIQQLIPNRANVLQVVRDLKKGKFFRRDLKRSLEDTGMQKAEIRSVMSSLSSNITSDIIAELKGHIEKILCSFVTIIVPTITISVFLVVLALIKSLEWSLIKHEYSSGQHNELHRHSPTKAQDCFWNNQRCRSCYRAASFEHCSNYVCGKNEACYMERLITVSSSVVYTGGCRNMQDCHANGRWMRGDYIACSKCCTGLDYCNDHLCGLHKSLAYSKEIDLTLCNSCDGKNGRPHPPEYPEDCFFIHACNSTKACFAGTFMKAEGTRRHYSSCESKKICQQMMQSIFEATAAIGRLHDEAICMVCCGDQECTQHGCERTTERIRYLDIHKRFNHTTMKEIP